MPKYLIVCAAFLVLLLSVAFAQTTPKHTPLQCVPANAGDTHPWDHNVEYFRHIRTTGHSHAFSAPFGTRPGIMVLFHRY